MGAVQLQPSRLTVDIEAELFRRLAEAAILGRRWDQLLDTAEALAAGDRLFDEAVTAIMDAAPEGTPLVSWAEFLRCMSSFLSDYEALKRSHGPKDFRAILKAFLDGADYTMPILDDAEREALGLAGALNGGSQHAA